MKFKYYIVDIFDGDVTGTDNIILAKELAEIEECFVIDAEKGIWLTEDATEDDIKERFPYAESEEFRTGA